MKTRKTLTEVARELCRTSKDFHDNAASRGVDCPECESIKVVVASYVNQRAQQAVECALIDHNYKPRYAKEVSRRIFVDVVVPRSGLREASKRAEAKRKSRPK